MADAGAGIDVLRCWSERNAQGVCGRVEIQLGGFQSRGSRTSSCAVLADSSSKQSRARILSEGKWELRIQMI